MRVICLCLFDKRGYLHFADVIYVDYLVRLDVLCSCSINMPGEDKGAIWCRFHFKCCLMIDLLKNLKPGTRFSNKEKREDFTNKPSVFN